MNNLVTPRLSTLLDHHTKETHFISQQMIDGEAYKVGIHIHDAHIDNSNKHFETHKDRTLDRTVLIIHSFFPEELNTLISISDDFTGCHDVQLMINSTVENDRTRAFIDHLNNDLLHHFQDLEVMNFERHDDEEKDILFGAVTWPQGRDLNHVHENVVNTFVRVMQEFVRDYTMMKSKLSTQVQ